MDADGGNPRNDSDWNPSWAPDGKKSKDNPDIYVMDADGENLRNITNHPEDEGGMVNSVLSVTPAGKTLTMWARLKQIDR